MPVKTSFSASEQDRLASCLRRLLPHTDPANLALTGGVAIELGVTARGHAGTRASIADLDFVAAHPGVVDPSVSREFLVSHYHVAQSGVPKFLIQLVDPRSKIRIDIFPDLTGALATARCVAVGQQSLRMLSLESIFAHKIQILSGASQEKPVDPKHVRDARTLGALLGRAVPQVPRNALCPDVYRIDMNLVCQRCALSLDPAFPLAPKSRIYELLGYV